MAWNITKVRSFAARLRKPEYTGENRCLACTIVNVVLVIIGGAAGGYVVSNIFGTILIITGLVAIYVRGYIVPGTPVLTQHFPEPVLAYFDGHEPATPKIKNVEESLDPEFLLRQAGAIKECPEIDDLCLTESFQSEWYDRMEAIQSDESLEILIQDLLGDTIVLTEQGEELYATANGQVVGRWPSRSAAIADLAADQELANRLSNWQSIDPDQRSIITRGLRPFLNRCPDCGDSVASEKVTSCCISGQAQTICHCPSCSVVLFRSEPYTD